MYAGRSGCQSGLVVLPTPMRVHRSGQFLSEGLFRHKGNLVPDDVVRGPRQFVGQRCMRDHEVALSQLTVVVGPGFVVKAPGKLGRLGEGPGKVLVAVFLVSFPLGFPIAGPLRRNHPAVRGEVANLLQSVRSVRLPA